MRYWYIDYENLTIVTIVRKFKEFRYLYIDVKDLQSGIKVRTLTTEETNPWRSYFPQTANQWRQNGGKEYKTLAELIDAHPNVFIDLL